jgi:hypothetical protein
MGAMTFRPEAMADVADENFIILPRSQQAGARVLFKDFGTCHTRHRTNRMLSSRFE